MPRTAESDQVKLPRVGEVIAGKYRIDKILGEGGMGTVYAAYHTMLDQHVALKLLAPSVAEDEENRSRFYNEARLARQIRSEHVVRIDDVAFLPSGVPFIVMEHLQGIDLADLVVKRGPLPVHEVCDYAIQGLDAIAQAHARGIVHRDLKPSNLFVAETETGERILKILDFGISKQSFHHSGKVGSLTSSGALLGSPFYMSPEQVRSTRKVDHKTDIWSLGVVLYELLTGRLPFLGEEMGEIFAAILEQEPVPIRKFRPEIPTGLEAVIMKCLEHNKDKRFSNAAELAHAVAPFATGQHSRLLDRINQSVAWGEEMNSGKVPSLRKAASSEVPAMKGFGHAETVAVPLDPKSGATLAMTDPDPSNIADLVPTASTVHKNRGRSSTRVVAVTVTAIAGLVGLGAAVIFVKHGGVSLGATPDHNTSALSSTAIVPVSAAVTDTGAAASSAAEASPASTPTAPPTTTPSAAAAIVAAPVTRPTRRSGSPSTGRSSKPTVSSEELYASKPATPAPPPPTTAAPPPPTPPPPNVPDILKYGNRN